MRWYCKKCRLLHEDSEMCPKLKELLRNNPKLLVEAANFTVIAGQYYLVTSQALDKIVQGVNLLTETDLSYEGTHQFARDIQIFRRLNEEPFSRSGHFADVESAQAYYHQVKDTPAFKALQRKLTGYSQEVDWIIMKQGEISSIWEKSKLLDNNAAGIDGITINRFNGEIINRTTIKASQNPITTNSTGIRDVKDAIDKGTAKFNDIIFGPDGTYKAARGAGLVNPVIEKNTAYDIQISNRRLEEKIARGEANTYVSLGDVAYQSIKGSIVGGAVALTVSSITNYIRYKNGELDKEEAFQNIVKDTNRGILVGGVIGAVTIFIPSGLVGFVAGIAVGIYVNKVCANMLDEIYGDGAFRAILDSSGYVYGMTFNLAEYYEKIYRNNKLIQKNLQDSKQINWEILEKFQKIEQLKGE